jgi:hypothetical protein
MRSAHRRPDGTFEYRGEIYRLEELPSDRFVVRRVRDGEVVGALRLADGRPEPHVEVEQGAVETGTLRAIAQLLDGSVGLVPLQ